MKLYFVGLMLASAAAQAQVYKCPDPSSGKITYSDAPCTGGRQIDRQRSQGEIMLERQQAAQSAQRTKAQDQRTLDAIQAQPDRYSQGSPVSGGGEGFACRQARREVEVAESVQTGSTQNRKSAIEFARKRAADSCGQQYAPPAPEPSQRDRIKSGQIPDQLVNCDGAGCWGISGMRYNKAAGNNFFRDDGAFCSGSATALNCSK